MHDANDERRDELPDHEFRDIEQAGDVGGGVMSTGGTATDRGTGTLGGMAQGNEEDGFDENDDARRDGLTGGLGDAIASSVEDDDDPPHLGTPAVPAHPEIDPTHLRR